MEFSQAAYILLSGGAGQGENKKPPADGGLIFSLLPSQTPTRLAVGLGPGSALFPDTSREIRPEFRFPRIHSLNGSRLLFDSYSIPQKINCQAVLRINLLEYRAP